MTRAIRQTAHPDLSPANISDNPGLQRGYRRSVGEHARAGALIGALTTAALAAVGYLGWTLAGFAFAPFDLFDRLTRELPGSIITIWINAAMAVLRVLHVGNTGAAAKAIEQVIAVFSFV